MPTSRRILSSSKKVGGLVPSKWDQLNPLYCANQNNLWINSASNIVANTYLPFPLTTNTELSTQYFCGVVPFSSGPNSYICVWSVNYSTNTVSVVNSTANFDGSTNFLPKSLKSGGENTFAGVTNYSLNLANNLILTGLIEGSTAGLSANIKFQSMLFNPSTNSISFGTVGSLNVSNLYGASWYPINSTSVILHYANGISTNLNANNILRVVTVNPSTGGITFETANTKNNIGYYRYGKKNASGDGAQIFQYQSVVMCNSTLGFIVTAASADSTSNSVQSEAFSLSGTSVIRDTTIQTVGHYPALKVSAGKSFNAIPVPLLRYPIPLSNTANVGVANTFGFVDGFMQSANTVSTVFLNPTYYPTPGEMYYSIPLFNTTSNTVSYKVLRYIDGSGASGNDSTVDALSIYQAESNQPIAYKAYVSPGIKWNYVNANGDIRVLLLATFTAPDGDPTVGNDGLELVSNWGHSVTFNVNLAISVGVGTLAVNCYSNSFNVIETQGNQGSGPWYPNSAISILSPYQGTSRGIFMGLSSPGGTTCQVVYRFLDADVNSQVNTYSVSNTYTAPRAGNVFIMCYGQGGRGNAASTADNATTYPGGGGGFSYKTITVTNGQTIPITFGQFGITCNTITVNAGSNSTTSALGAGGQASGGDVNANGSVGTSGINANGTNGPLGYDTGKPGSCGFPGPAKTGFGFATSLQVYGSKDAGSWIGTGGKAFSGAGQVGGPGLVIIGIK